jgi:hypothetical protein
MKRRRMAFVAAAAAVGAVAGLIPLTQAKSYELVEVCTTITPKFIGVSINGNPVGAPFPGAPRSCFGV